MNQIQSQLNQAVEVLNKGGVIIFPTDTVWGIGASVESDKGIQKLYQFKNRPSSKPTVILVATIKQAKKYGIFNQNINQIIDKHWPGALTIIVNPKDTVPSSITGNTNSVGIRVPDNSFVQSICQQLKSGLVTASANLSGQPAPIKKSNINPSLLDQVDMIIDHPSQNSPSGKSSTIIDVTESKIKIVRQGTIKL